MPSMSTRAAVGAVAAIAVLAVFFGMRSGGSNDKQSAATDGGAGGGDADADAAAHVVHGRPGCHPTLEGGTRAKVAPGALSLAVVKDRALLVSTVGGGGGGGGGARAERIALDRMGASTGAVDPDNDALAPAPGVTIFAAATSLDGLLGTLTYAARRPTPGDCADGLLVTKLFEPDAPRREILTHSCRAASLLVAATRGSLGIAVLDGATKADGDPKTAPAVADVVVIAGLTSAQTRLETIGEGVTIAQAAAAAGATSVAAAYVVAHGGTRELHVVQLGANGKTTTKVEVLDKQNVGTVTLAYEGDVLHVVWSSFVPQRNRYVLRWSKWLAGAEPSAAQAIGTGVLSAITPSLAINRGRFMLAWANGEEKATTVKVGASTSGVAAIAGLANVVSTPTVLARDPVVALDGDAMFVAWKELDGGSGSVGGGADGGEASARVHAASISCRE